MSASFVPSRLEKPPADRYPDTQVVLFTDAECRDMHNIDVVYVGDDTWNAAVLSLSYEEKNDLLYLYGSVVSTGMDAVLPVGLEIDGQILDVQLAECQDDVATEVTLKIRHPYIRYTVGRSYHECVARRFIHTRS